MNGQWKSGELYPARDQRSEGDVNRLPTGRNIHEDLAATVEQSDGRVGMLSITDLEGVVSNFYGAVPAGDVNGLVDGINHYREYDAYKYV